MKILSRRFLGFFRFVRRFEVFFDLNFFMNKLVGEDFELRFIFKRFSFNKRREDSGENGWCSGRVEGR